MNRFHLKAWVLTGSILSGLLSAQPIAAQVIPDATLPAGEQSQVTGDPNVQIDGGARRGGNLFHSFSQFSIPTGGSAYFNNAADVQNILTRVTGQSISNIDGLIRANGTANLFVINPNGIIFGPNASLNIGGSFVASTASSIQFADGTEFSAVNPSASPLLTISVPLGLQFNGTEGDIVVRSRPELPPNNSLLEAGDAGQTLETSQTVNESSEMGFNAISGTLSDTNDVDLYRLSLAEGQAFTATTLGQTQVDTQLFLFDASGFGLAANDDADGTFQSRVPANQPFIPSVSGTYYLGISSYGNDPLSPSGNIFSSFGEGAELPLSGWSNTGIDQGDYTIRLMTNSLSSSSGGLRVGAGTTLALIGGGVNLEGGQLVAPGGRVEVTGVETGTVGLTVAGSSVRSSVPVGVQRSDVSLTNGAEVNVISGGGGSIAVNARNLEMTGESFLRAGIGEGLGTVETQAGDISINATGAINLNDKSQINTDVQSGANGQGGDVLISASSLRLEDGAQINASTYGAGNGGNLSVEAQDVQIIGTSADGQFFSGLSARAQPNSTGNGGDLTIKTNTLLARDGGGVDTGTYGGGKGGNLSVEAQDVQLIGTGADGQSSSGLFTVAVPASSGNVGDLTIKTNTLLVQDGARVATLGAGNGGNLSVDAQDVQLIGTSANGQISGGLFVFPNAPDSTENIGDLTIKTNTLLVRDGATIGTAAFAAGNGGNLSVDAQDVQLIGTSANGRIRSGLFTSAQEGTTGDAGNLTVRTNTLLVRDGAVVSAGTSAAGNGGNLSVDAQDVQLLGISADGQSSSGLFASATRNSTGNAGDLTIKTNTLLVRDGAVVNASTSGEGNGGNLRVDADTVRVSSGGQLLTTTFSSGNAGNITVNTPDLQLSGATSGLFAQTTSTGNAGNLTIQPRDNGQRVRVNLQDGAQISASTFSSGRGGDLTITAPDSITLTGNGSIIAAGTGSNGAGGNLNLRTGTLNIQNRAEVTVSSSGTGTAGSLFVDADRIYLNNQARIRADTSGGGGNIELRSPLIVLRNGSNISTNATGENIPGGNIAIDTRFLIAVLNEDSNISANSTDFRGGNVSINAFSIFGIQPSLVSTPLSDITATGATSALSGTIDITTAGFDPTAGLVALPTDLGDPGLIAQGCPANEGNSFVITGRGGLPPTPEQQLDDDAEWSDRRRLVVAGSGGHGDTETRGRQDSQNSKLPPTPIIEATGIQATPTGEVFLVTGSSSSVMQNRLNRSAVCSGGESR